MTDTSSEEWRRICEARHVCRMATKQDRKAYLDAVGKKRGAKPMNELAEEVQTQWAERQKWAADSK